jgi:hypothetical protein
MIKVLKTNRYLVLKSDSKIYDNSDAFDLNMN